MKLEKGRNKKIPITPDFLISELHQFHSCYTGHREEMMRNTSRAGDGRGREGETGRVRWEGETGRVRQGG